MSFWTVVIKAPKDAQSKIVLEYLPAMIFFECDSDLKGIAVCSDQDNAQMFREQVARLTTFEVLCIPLHTADDVRAWTDILLKYLGPKKYKSLPIYLDPPDPYCKGVNVPWNHKDIWTFISEKMSPETNPLAEDVVGFERVGVERTIAILRDKSTGKYAALVVKCAGTIYSGGVEMVLHYLDNLGTTHDSQWKKTAQVDSIFQAQKDAKEIPL